jgi:hypothetical protein
MAVITAKPWMKALAALSADANSIGAFRSLAVFRAEATRA